MRQRSFAKSGMVVRRRRLKKLYGEDKIYWPRWRNVAMGERYFPYIVREVIEPIDEMRHLPNIVRYIKCKPRGGPKRKKYGTPNPWRWTYKRAKAHVFARRYEAEKAAELIGGGELVRADS